MPTTKKRPSKTAKAAAKKLAESKLLTVVKKPTEAGTTGDEFKSGGAASKTSSANKLRPEKKKG